MDKIDNDCERARKILEEPFDLCDLNLDPFQFRASGPLPEPQLVDDPVKYKVMLKHLGDCNYAVLACLRHTFRSFYGFTCWIMVRCGTKGAQQSSDGQQSERLYLVDGIALRRHLKGSDSQESVGLGEALLSNPEIVKVLVGEGTLLQLAYEFGQAVGLSNYVTV